MEHPEQIWQHNPMHFMRGGLKPNIHGDVAIKKEQEHHLKQITGSKDPQFDHFATLKRPDHVGDEHHR